MEPPQPLVEWTTIPRPVTPRIRRRAWFEPRVRAWLMVAAATVIAGGMLAYDNFGEWRRQAWLAHHGTPINAAVIEAAAQNLKGHRVAVLSDTVVVLEFDWHGSKHQVAGVLADTKPGKSVEIGATLPIRIDPDDPNRWTDRSDAPPLGPTFIGASIVLALALAATLAGLRRRAALLRAWREGEAALARVVERRQSALAPHCVLVSFSMGDGRTVEAFVPAASPEAGSEAAGWALPLSAKGRAGLSVAWMTA